MWAHGFRNCFTPLPGCFSPFPHGTSTLSVRQIYLDLHHGRCGFTRDSTRPALLGNHARETTDFQVRGWHPLRPGLQACSPDPSFYHSRPARRDREARPHNTMRATPDGYHARTVWSHPLSLATTHGVSFPAGTEMFHFPAYPRNNRSVPAHDGRRVPPFGDPRIKALLEAPLGLSHPQTSFIGTVCQGIHPTPSPATPHTTKHMATGSCQQDRLMTNFHHTANDHKTIDLEPNPKQKGSGEIAIKQRKTNMSSDCSRPLSSSQTTTRATEHTPRKQNPQGHDDGRDHATPAKGCGGGPGAQKRTHTTPPTGNTSRKTNDLFHTSIPRTSMEPFHAPEAHDRHQRALKTP